MDLISNEMLKYGFDHLKEVILKLFDLISAARSIPSKWRLGLISPTYKSGEKLDPDDYRGICVISCLSKLFMLVLNESLSNFIKVNEILNQTQIGFQKKRRTADHVFTLKTITNKYLSASKGKLYTCFVDHKKAYDSVWHEGLFAKLKCLNIVSPFK